MTTKQENIVRHIVPHTHWDREWYRTFEEFRIRLVRLIDRLLDILEHDEDFSHFMLDGQTSLLEDYLKIRPERREYIKQLVREGRLSIGPWYVLPDEFLVAPESLVRNIMLGQQISKDFGASMPVGYIPDLFGHVGQLPQILQSFGMDNAVLRRGLADNPVELWWDAPDGSRVLVCYLRNGYDNATRLPMTNPDAFVAAIKKATDRLTPHVQSGQILLLAGNDHQEPDPRLSALIRYANQTIGEDDTDYLIHSSLPSYIDSVFKAVKDQELSVVKGELRSPQIHHLLPGVLSTRMWLKQRNEEVETLLLRWTEPFSAWAELLVDKERSVSDSHTHLSAHETLAYVQDNSALIWHAWKILLDNHPHDSICGCSIDQVHREMAYRFEQSEQIAEDITTFSLETIANQVNTKDCVATDESKEGYQPLIVFNPTHARTDVIHTDLCLLDSKNIEVVSSDGQILTHSVMAENRNTTDSDIAKSHEDQIYMDREFSVDELAPYLSQVRGGKISGNIIHHIKLVPPKDSETETAKVLITIGKKGTPNRAEVTKTQLMYEELLIEGQVKRFRVLIHKAKPCCLSFIAPELPSYGYKTFMIRPAQASSKPEVLCNPKSLTLENNLFIVKADPNDGTITLTDKRTSNRYAGLNRFVDGGDRGDTYNYCEPEQDIIVSSPAQPPIIRILEHNSVMQVLEIQQHYNLPTALHENRELRTKETTQVRIISQLSIFSDVPRIDIKTTVNNLVEDHRLRVHFPIAVSVDTAYTENHFHAKERPVPQNPPQQDTSDWIEQPVSTVPQRGWADVSDGQTGLMIANKGLPEVEFIPENNSTTIALTLLRCIGWLSRDDIHCRNGRAGSFLDTPEAQCLGKHTFEYSIIPHEGNWKEAFAHAEAFRTPLRAITTEIQDGPLTPNASLVDVESSSFILTTIKQPENKLAGLVVRGVNMSDEATTVHLRPAQILGPLQRFSKAMRTDLNENEQEVLDMSEDSSIKIAVKPWQLVTIKWEI